MHIEIDMQCPSQAGSDGEMFQFLKGRIYRVTFKHAYKFVEQIKLDEWRSQVELYIEIRHAICKKYTALPKQKPVQLTRVMDGEKEKKFRTRFGFDPSQILLRVGTMFVCYQIT